MNTPGKARMSVFRSTCSRGSTGSGLWLSIRIPGATRTDAVRMVLQRGLESLESETVDRPGEDRSWMRADLSRLGEFEPYDFGGLDPDHLGTPVRHLPDGAVEIEESR